VLYRMVMLTMTFGDP